MQTMKEAVHEHLYVPIGFDREISSPTRAKRGHPGPSTSRAAGNQRLALPEVSILNTGNSRRSRLRHSERRCLCFTMSTWYKLGLLVLGCTFYKEIVEILSMKGQGDASPPSIKHDYSIVTSPYDLSTRGVDPWCAHNQMGCPCQDPLIPKHRKEEHKSWEEVHLANKAAAADARDQDLDVVFLGDSITEGWNGKVYGQYSPRLDGVNDVFKSLFSTEMGGEVDGIALGIAGDTSPSLLWRLQNGEVPGQLNSKVFWILIGTNDLGNTWCSPELVVIGVIRIVEQIRSLKPSSTVVINGLLPRSFNEEGYVAKGGRWKPSVWEDILAINEELRSYAHYRQNVEYFNTNLFFIDGDNKNTMDSDLQLDSILMPDFLHPSSIGYNLWGQEIVSFLQEILDEQ